MTDDREIRFLWWETDRRERLRIANRLSATGRRYVVQFFSHAEEAASMPALPPDLIVLHIGAKSIDAVEILEAIRHHQWLRGIKVVFLTEDCYDTRVADIFAALR